MLYICGMENGLMQLEYIILAALAIGLVLTVAFLVWYVRSSRKQLDILKRNVSNLYIKQTQAANLRTESQQKPRHEKPDFRAMMADHGTSASAPVQSPAPVSEPSEPESVNVTVHAAVRTPKPATAQQQDAETPKKRAQTVLSEEALIENLRELIEKNLSDPDLSIAKLASELCMSRSGLFAKVKAATGDTPNNMISEARLSKARELLEEGKRPINEIGYMVGYSTPSYFSRCFLKRYGETPHAWMNSHKG